MWHLFPDFGPKLLEGAPKILSPGFLWVEFDLQVPKIQRGVLGNLTVPG